MNNLTKTEISVALVIGCIVYIIKLQKINNIFLLSSLGQSLYCMEYFIIIAILIFCYYKRRFFMKIFFLSFVVIYLSAGFSIFNNLFFYSQNGEKTLFKAEIIKKDKQNTSGNQFSASSGFERSITIHIRDDNMIDYKKNQTISISNKPLENAIAIDRMLPEDEVVIKGLRNNFSTRVEEIKWKIVKEKDGYELAKQKYVEGDKQEAFSIWKKLAEEKHQRACYQVGVSYLYGDGTEKNEEKARYWVKKSKIEDRVIKSKLVL